METLGYILFFNLLFLPGLYFILQELSTQFLVKFFSTLWYNLATLGKSMERPRDSTVNKDREIS